ncbi:DUF4176 domain-containing protein [Bacillus paralicheniformis]|uniref:DUF4176 domain-containing protein n=1 Tax=Bacillus TaxID=1386 RepID=UPI00041B6BBC|nr:MULTISPECIES: DUF4176 domain-containing protein [Bacillus]NVB35454.1 DUF4176 domain-containing protein [Bacillus licheniformis]MBL7477973.1 DUF4176 domain-containing protein [Bacillus paralicheniformis]MCJ8221767.1 DUF4176 domain-containing protein [Bacillus paralicheniformis]MCQ5456943.1 DUF4176 domain-containing protein [Bacillus paralicheniformis]MCU4666416.1 DUF4176 domain-containing protein [Bacillus paralicheniformis]
MFNEKKDEEHISEDWLPIGTVVKIKSVRKPVMVYGRNQIQSSSQKKFDYVSVPYPEGNITEDYNLFFNHHMIEEILYMGYVTNEELNYKKTLGPKMHDKEI